MGIRLKSKAVLFFPYNPHPFSAGNQKRVREILESLINLNFEVHFLSMNFFEEPWNPEGQQALKNIGVQTVSIYRLSNFEKKIRKWLLPKIEKYFSKWKANLFFLNPPFLKRWFKRQILRIQPDLILINYAYWGNLADDVEKPTLKVMEVHDLVSVNSSMRWRLEKNWKDAKPVTQEDYNRMTDEFWDESLWLGDSGKVNPWEYGIYEKFDLTIAISNNESSLIQANTRKTKVVPIPYICPSDDSKNKNDYQGPPFFPAGKHIFNVHGYLFFLKKIWPLLIAQNRELKLRVSGEFKNRVFEQSRIEFLDFEEDITTIYQTSSFAICPIISGTGQSLKIVEAMAQGLPVVATKYCAGESLLNHGYNGFVAENADEFARYFIQLWNDRSLCRLMGENARETILKEHGKNNYEVKIKQAILNSSRPDLIGQTT